MFMRKKRKISSINPRCYTANIDNAEKKEWYYKEKKGVGIWKSDGEFFEEMFFDGDLKEKKPCHCGKTH